MVRKIFTSSTPPSYWAVKCEKLIGLVITLSLPDQSHFNFMYTDQDSYANWPTTTVCHLERYCITAGPWAGAAAAAAAR